MLTLGSRILEEQFYDVNVLRAGEGVAADAHAERLAEPDVRGLRDGLVGERAGARDDADVAGPVDVAWLDAHLAAEGVDDAGAVRADETGLGL